ncbi:peptidoglycan-binding domain-containing protein [Cereibacter azotoformans]|uniref:D-alanyl-D-alanine carboxypeptidase-like protein n=1 Tax=Cereibacter azotoformans TaxID=43057 RepID=A0A2T5JN40_9RHOB|nr:M15 family metallopeptidase [Cereibacter azotoformans]MBO4169565.1 M15 family metallopeptidase [Cereibacter azotoformans]PTR08723.1 D-alanyl-D-alanine carboxypeptidase-like protein [Cereibacter azotoformans]
MTRSNRMRDYQAALAGLGYDPGPLDGTWGPKTAAAARALLAAAGSPYSPGPAAAAAPTTVRFDPPAYGDMTRVFGEAGGPDCTAGKVALQIAFRIAWEQSTTVTSFRCHRLLAPSFTSIFAAAVSHYGEARFRELRLDMWGGCYADRPMRGGSKKSTHAWGAAVDVDPERNQLSWGRTKASMAAPEYEAWWRIVEAHGAISLGRTQDRDWMHLQFCK